MIILNILASIILSFLLIIGVAIYFGIVEALTLSSDNAVTMMLVAFCNLVLYITLMELKFNKDKR